MVALIASIIVTIVALIPFGFALQRRAKGTFLTWGEAMVASTWAFFLMFWVYGVVPHQWLTLADNEWNWRADRIVVGPGEFLELLPFTLNYVVLRDLIAVGIYVVALVINVALWMIWQNRGAEKKPALEASTSRYGRPLVKEGT
ncbi:MAG: hypothetical protein S0880_11120 [Actinomycetota bacterium]|nr:hypothetical protein [Actinomycetota bacterium]